MMFFFDELFRATVVLLSVLMEVQFRVRFVMVMNISTVTIAVAFIRAQRSSSYFRYKSPSRPVFL